MLDWEERGALCLLRLTIHKCMYMCIYVYINIQINIYNKCGCVGLRGARGTLCTVVDYIYMYVCVYICV